MKRLSALMAVVLAVAGFGIAYAQTPLPPPEAYGRLPAVGGAAISPDGQHIALFVGQGDAGQVAIHRIDNDTFPRIRVLNAPPGGSIRGVDFADDRFALVSISQTFDPTQASRRAGSRVRGSVAGGATERADATDATEFFRQLTVDITNGETAFMLSNARYSLYRSSLGSVSAPIENDPGYGRVISVDYGSATPGVVIYRVNLSDGVGAVVQRGGEHTWYYCYDAAGAAYARMDYNEDRRRWSILSVNGSNSREVISGVVADDEEWRIPSLGCRIQGRSPDVVALIGYAEGADRISVRELNLTSGAQSALYEHEQYDVGVLRDPYSREVIGYGWTAADADETVFPDADIRAVYEQIAARFNGGQFTVQGWDRARNRFIVSSDSLPAGPATFLFERQSNRLRLIGYSYPELAESQVPVRQAITYRARDGVRIPAFLTLPPGRDPTNLPLVVMPHGGPHASNVRGFDWWSAFMASRGYAVLEPDFRGSTGYGRAWEEAGHGNWGNGVMQHDVTDGVQALIRNGVADASRVCIVGASYGGYAALAGVAFTPDLYACAVSVAGVSDMRRMFLREIQVAGADSGVSRFWSASMGTENFERDSPAQHIDRIRAPVLLIHGAHDTIVPYDQSTWMERRLREAGKPVRLVELRGDDHWLSDASTRTQMLREIEQFLSEHIGQSRN